MPIEILTKIIDYTAKETGSCNYSDNQKSFTSRFNLYRSGFKLIKNHNKQHQSPEAQRCLPAKKTSR